MALARGVLHKGDVVMCLTGLPRKGTLDTMVVMELGEEEEMFSAPDLTATMPEDIQPEVLDALIDLASSLGSEGREGKPVGALFVLGDDERVLSLSRQLILNPFRGYSDEERHLLHPQTAETVKELASVDGAFVLRGDGVLQTAGAFLKTASQEEHPLPSGLGSRHHAAAGITAVTNAVAITVSESTGTVMVFRNGRMLTEIERPRALGTERRR